MNASRRNTMISAVLRCSSPKKRLTSACHVRPAGIAICARRPVTGGRSAGSSRKTVLMNMSWMMKNALAADSVQASVRAVSGRWRKMSETVRSKQGLE